MRGELFAYVFDIVQEEECLIWDIAITDPLKWLNEYCDDLEIWEEEGTWISSVVDKMLDSYKEAS
jgi:hypothetical protein